jgi:hypothetical protein
MWQGLSSINVKNDPIDGFTVTARCLGPTSHFVRCTLYRRLSSLYVATFSFDVAGPIVMVGSNFAVYNLMPSFWAGNEKESYSMGLLFYILF